MFSRGILFVLPASVRIVVSYSVLRQLLLSCRADFIEFVSIFIGYVTEGGVVKIDVFARISSICFSLLVNVFVCL